jgi:hypothetical protein
MLEHQTEVRRPIRMATDVPASVARRHTSLSRTSRVRDGRTIGLPALAVRPGASRICRTTLRVAVGEYCGPHRRPSAAPIARREAPTRPCRAVRHRQYTGPCNPTYDVARRSIAPGHCFPGPLRSKKSRLRRDFLSSSRIGLAAEGSPQSNTQRYGESGHQAVTHSENKRRHLDFCGKRDGDADDNRRKESPPIAQGEPGHKPSGKENRNHHAQLLSA